MSANSSLNSYIATNQVISQSAHPFIVILPNGEQISIQDINAHYSFLNNLPPIIYFTAHIRNIDALNQLIELGADLTIEDSFGTSALHYAAMGGDLEIVDILINHNPSLVNLMDVNGVTALMYAAMNGYHDLVAELIEDGADINATDNNNNNASNYATNHPETLQILQSHIANGINTDNVQEPSLTLSGLYFSTFLE